MTNEEIVQTITRHGATLEALSMRVDKAEAIIEEIRELTTTTQLIAQRQNNIDEKLDSLTVTVKALDDKPKNNWDKAIWLIIGVVITAITTAIMSKLL